MDHCEIKTWQLNFRPSKLSDWQQHIKVHIFAQNRNFLNWSFQGTCRTQTQSKLRNYVNSIINFSRTHRYLWLCFLLLSSIENWVQFTYKVSPRWTNLLFECHGSSNHKISKYDFCNKRLSLKDFLYTTSWQCAHSGHIYSIKNVSPYSFFD